MKEGIPWDDIKYLNSITDPVEWRLQTSRNLDKYREPASERPAPSSEHMAKVEQLRQLAIDLRRASRRGFGHPSPRRPRRRSS